VFKSAVRAREIDDHKLGFDDFGYVAFAREGYLTDRAPIWAHEDLLRLAGIDHPMLHMEPFSPRQWVQDFEENHGGLAGYRCDGLIVLQSMDGGERWRARHLLGELHDCVWKARAIHFYLAHRWEKGCDPLTPFRGERRRGLTRDGRLLDRNGLPLNAFRLGEIITFYDRQGMQMFVDPIVDWTVL
jgi:hypothetical protein